MADPAFLLDLISPEHPHKWSKQKPVSGLQEEEDGQDWPAACSRRDANLFLRGVKRFGTIDRLPDIAAEIGPSFDNISDAAR